MFGVSLLHPSKLEQASQPEIVGWYKSADALIWAVAFWLPALLDGTSPQANCKDGSALLLSMWKANSADKISVVFCC